MRMIMGKVMVMMIVTVDLAKKKMIIIMFSINLTIPGLPPASVIMIMIMVTLRVTVDLAKKKIMMIIMFSIDPGYLVCPLPPLHRISLERIHLAGLCSLLSLSSSSSSLSSKL